MRGRGGRGFFFFSFHKGNVRADLHKESTYPAEVPLSHLSLLVYLISRPLHVLKEMWLWSYCERMSVFILNLMSNRILIRTHGEKREDAALAYILNKTPQQSHTSAPA